MSLSSHFEVADISEAAGKPGSKLCQISRLTARPCRSVIKVRDVIVGVTAITLGGVIGDAQVVKPRKKDQDSNNQHWDGAIVVL